MTQAFSGKKSVPCPTASGSRQIQSFQSTRRWDRSTIMRPWTMQPRWKRETCKRPLNARVRKRLIHQSG